MASGSDNFNSALFKEEIQKYECLYSKLCKDYKNKFISLNCWKKIGEKFQVTPDEAEKKYKYIPTSYGRWLKKRKNVPSGSGRDAVPKVLPEFENLVWLSNHINHKHVAISNLPTQEVSDIEESPDLAVDTLRSPWAPDTLDEGQDLQSQVPEAESPDSGSVSKRLPSSTRSSSNSPVEEAQRKEGAKVIKKKRAWSSQKSNQDKHTKEDVDMELLKTAKSIAEGLQADQRTVSEVEDEDSFYCKSLATRMRSLDPQSKAYVRMQIEQLMFQVQFGGQVSNSSLPGKNFYLSQGPHSNPSHCNRQGLQFGNSLDSYHLQNLN